MMFRLKAVCVVGNMPRTKECMIFQNADDESRWYEARCIKRQLALGRFLDSTWVIILVDSEIAVPTPPDPCDVGLSKRAWEEACMQWRNRVLDIALSEIDNSS